MQQYEAHYISPDFPIIFHRTKLLPYMSVYAHWHENIEILNILSGDLVINLDDTVVYASKGDTIVVNSNVIHNISSTENESEYMCLIIENEFLQKSSFDVVNYIVLDKFCDAEVTKYFSLLTELSIEKSIYYKTLMTAQSLMLICHIFKNYRTEGNLKFRSKSRHKIDMVKKSISYMKNNYHNPITLNDISSHVGFTKNYFCRVFKDITGTTTFEMLNHLRCDAAKKLLTVKTSTISEVAEKCGFSNYSYFSKTYKRIMGCLPKETTISAFNQNII